MHSLSQPVHSGVGATLAVPVGRMDADKLGGNPHAISDFLVQQSPKNLLDDRHNATLLRVREQLHDEIVFFGRHSCKNEQINLR